MRSLGGSSSEPSIKQQYPAVFSIYGVEDLCQSTQIKCHPRTDLFLCLYMYSPAVPTMI